MDRLFWRWGLDTPRPRALAPAYPPRNVWETPEAFHLEAELPGMKQEDLHIAVTNRNTLTLAGERKLDGPSGCPLKGSWHRRERGFGRFQRVLTLPSPVNAEQVEARLENGVLLLTRPKAEEARPRRIEVKAE
jgi:HSP20 family protein